MRLGRLRQRRLRLGRVRQRWRVDRGCRPRLRLIRALRLRLLRAQPAGGHTPEFLDWRWERAAKLPELIIPFKRKVYEDVVAAFAHLVK